MNNSYITIIKEKRTVLSRKRVPLNQNECTADFGIGVPFEQNLHTRKIKVDKTVYILEKLGFKWAPVGKKEFMSAYKKIKKL